jgi:hypothetical protein
MDFELATIEKMQGTSDFLPTAPLHTIADATQRMKDGLKMGDFWWQHHLPYPLQLASRIRQDLADKVARGDSFNAYQSAWIKTHDQIMESYKAECQRLNRPLMP